ncbi:MAG: cardiolipin synthase [Clostridia bacterium]|nr:cardiolipin synthase [Clostridia bacterium]
MHFSKGIFSRLFIVGFSIVAQFALFMMVISRLNEFHIAFNITMHIISFAVIVSIINRDMITEAKIPWIIITLLVPLFGTVLYLCLSEYKLSRKQKKQHQLVIERIEKHFSSDKRTHFKLMEIAGKYKGQCRYILKNTRQFAYENTDTEFYPDGESFWNSLKEELSKAKKYIFMEYFIIEDGIMWNSIFEILKEKAASGVEVRLMYDDLGSVNTLEWDFDRQMRRNGIICVKFNPFKPVISERHNNRDHRKITVVDGDVAFVGGLNLADEYINAKQRFGYWKDTAIRLRGNAVKSLAALFLQNYDDQTGIVENYASYLSKDYAPNPGAKGIIQPYGDGPRPAYGDYVAANIFLNMINQSERYIWITTPYLIIDSKLQNALCTAAMRGVDVRIITPHIPDKKAIFAMTRSYYHRLQAGGVKIYEYTPGFMHAKQVICDDEAAIVGTINLDYRSLIHHYECGVFMVGTKCISDIKQDFINLFSCSQNMLGFSQKRLVTLLCRLGTAFTPLL